LIVGSTIGFTSSSQNESVESLTIANVESHKNVNLQEANFPIDTGFANIQVHVPEVYKYLKEGEKTKIGPEGRLRIWHRSRYSQ